MSSAVKPVAREEAIDCGNDAQSIIAATERLAGAEKIFVDHPYGPKWTQGVPLAVLPKGKRVCSLKPLLDEYATAPDRITGTATLRDEDSFIAHVLEMRLPTTRIFANPDAASPSLTAVYDYHAVDGENQQPAFGVHRAYWPLELSKEWKAWIGAAGKSMSPTEFAEFLEKHVPDVYWGDQHSDYTKTLISQLELRLATPSSLIALSRNLAVNVDVQVRQAQTLASGEIAITYVEQHKDGEGLPIKVPNAFLIAIPVILGGPAYQLLARLRYRIREGKVSWAYDLHRVDIAFDAAVKEICERVQMETDRTVFLGSPEK
jgi:uncharacterized protein YfdQ (DUF2303 family)